MQAPIMSAKPKVKRQEGPKFVQEIDTNVFSINMTTLKHGSELATGDPIFCKGCQAAFNMHSKYEIGQSEEP